MLQVYVVSDSTGETANAVANSLMIQFPKLTFNRCLFPNIDTVQKVDSMFQQINKKTLIVMTVIMQEVVDRIKQLASEKDVEVIDILGNSVNLVEDMTGEKALRVPGLMRDTDNEYFNKMEAIEFAMKYDDGKNPNGFKLSDIVLVGVSRTSKTPLSIYLANKKYKVSNLPLLPESTLPEEIFEVDSKRVIGLIIDEVKLKEIRNQRLKTLGLGEESIYANNKRIEDELDYAKGVFDKLGCKVINVTGYTIESIANQIIKYIEE